MKKILIVFGTRPEAIKIAPLIKKVEKENIFDSRVCVTAQHREMLDQVLSFFKIVPDYDLSLMSENQSLNELSARILKNIDSILLEFNPDLVIVHGDTTTSTMVSLASFNRQIKVAHVEAGLRTYNKLSPFPEEINRQITGRLADIHFAPTQKSKENLLKELIDEKNIYVTGNTVIDALLWGVSHVNHDRKEIVELNKFIDHNKKLIVVTGHRRENFGKKFLSFCNALKNISKIDNVQMIYPVHLNPNVKNIVEEELKNISNIKLVNPLDYEVFIWLLNQSYFIITDSGGIQEEAPSLGKPVLVTRDVTERQEAVTHGNVKLVGTDAEIIFRESKLLLESKEEYSKMAGLSNPYGDGKAADRINNILKTSIE